MNLEPNPCRLSRIALPATEADRSEVRREIMKDELDAQASRQQNSCQPVSCLPSEVLVEIIEMVLQSKEGRVADDRTPAGRQYEILHSVAEVCRAWRDVILQTSIFWTVISSDLEPPLQKSILARSKDALLDVNSSLRGRHSAFLELMKPHSHRWRSLRVSRARARDLEIIEGCVAPELRVLLIVDSYGPREDRHYDLPGNHLKRLSLSGLSVPWNFKGLIELELINVAPYGPSLDDLVEVLTYSPLLTRLVLTDFTVTVSPTCQPQEVTIRLPALTYLVLSKIGVSNIDYIAGSIEGFVCKYLVIEESLWGGGGMSELFVHCPSYLSSSVESLTRNSTVSQVKIHFSFATLDIEGHGPSGEERIKINLPTTSVLEVLTLLSTVCFHGCEVHFSSDMDMDDEEFAQFMLFSWRTNIVGLSLKAHRNSVDILRHLSVQHCSFKNNKESLTWSYPSLRDLRIRSPSAATARQVINMVEARYGTAKSVEASASDQTLSESILPKSLKYLEISGIRDLTTPVLSRLGSILGEETIRCRPS